MIICEICKKEFKYITISHLNRHNIDFIKYLEMFPNANLISKETQMKMSSNHKGMEGKKHTEEFKKKLREFNSGENNPFYGEHHTEESKQKQREKMLDRYDGENNPFYGKHHTEEFKERQRENHSDMWGENNPFYGKHHTEEFKEKMQKPKSEEHKQKMRENAPDRSGKKNPMYGKKAARLSGIGKGSYYDSPLQGTIWLRSSYEIAYAKYLDEHKILWMYEMETFELSNEMTYTPDFFLPKFKKFIDTKGYMKKEAQEKINKFKEEYPWDLEILYKEDLIKLGINIK